MSEAKTANEIPSAHVVLRRPKPSTKLRARWLDAITRALRRLARRNEPSETSGAELLEVGDAFFEVDPECRGIRANTKEEEHSRMPCGEAVGCILWKELLKANSDLDERLKQLRSALEQKDILVREVQHRVKNNLQVISSLLALEAERFDGGDALKALQESRDRVRSMALVHDKLCHSGDLSEIDFGDYIDSLAKYLVDSYGLNPEAVQLHTDVDIKLNMDQAVPCGLIFQELLSNSMKHAFPADRGEIYIHFHRVQNNLTLNYRDSGIGLSSSVDLTNPQTLGLQLVTDLAGQLGGRLQYRYQGGAVFNLSFPLHVRQSHETNESESPEVIRKAQHA